MRFTSVRFSRFVNEYRRKLLSCLMVVSLVLTMAPLPCAKGEVVTDTGLDGAGVYYPGGDRFVAGDKSSGIERFSVAFITNSNLLHAQNANSDSGAPVDKVLVKDNGSITLIPYTFNEGCSYTAWNQPGYEPGVMQNDRFNDDILQTSVGIENEISFESSNNAGNIINISDMEQPLAFVSAHIQYVFGYPDGTVKPDLGITRAEAAAVFHRLLSNDNKNDFAISTFTDISTEEWYYQPIAFLEAYGVLYGYPDGTYRPDEIVTRAEYAVIASRFDDLEVSASNRFSDVTDDHWAVGFINSAAAKGWVTGNEEGAFEPGDSITRAQVVTIINRILNRAIRQENIPVDVKGYKDLPKTHWAYSALIEASDTHEYDLTDGDATELWIDRRMSL